MPNRILLRPSDHWSKGREHFDWVLYDSTGTKAVQGTDSALEEIEQIMMQNGLESVRTTLLWPSSHTLLTSVAIPGKSQRFLNQALAFAVEEQLAQDIALMHFAVSSKHKKGEYAVACIEKASFLTVFDSVLGADDIILKDSFVDAMLLPLEDHDFVISLESHNALVRTAKSEAMGTAVENLIPYLDSVFLLPEEEEASSKTAKVYLHGDAKDYQLLIAELQQYPSLDLEVEETKIGQLELLAEAFFHSGGPDINLCQGDFKIQTQNGGSFRRWALVAGVAALAFFIQVGVFIGKGSYYQSKSEQVSQQALTEYKRLMPASNTTDASRLARIVKGQLRQNENTGEDIGFMALLGEAGYQYTRASGRSNIDFVSLNYNEERGELVIELRAKSFEQLDQLKTALINGGLEAKISSAVQEQDFFRGRLSVGAG